jgi:hypothetical protein
MLTLISNWYYVLLFLLTIFLLVVSFTSHPATIPSWLGSVSVVALFLVAFVFFSSNIFYFGYKRKVAVIVLLVTLAITFSLFNWNDNHHFRELKGNDNPPLLGLEESFGKWLRSRQEGISRFNNQATKATNKKKDNRYPVYIVSAQGGGIFAAYHAALTLSRLQDLCPSFAHHVFAISGVSGGSLGATAFSSLIKQEAAQHALEEQSCLLPGKSDPILENKAHQLLDRDFLSPLLAAGLFPDLLQRFLFLAIEDLDRARGLEYAFEQAWQQTQQQPNLLQNSYYEHWSPDKAAPALVFNTTVVETGDRLLLSPFKIDLPNLKDIRTVAQREIDFPLSTAAVLSARFPFVTPVGWFKQTIDGKEYQSRLADGGYFENSGVSTALEIGSRLETHLRKKGIDDQVKIIFLAITDKPDSKPQQAGGLNELLSPIQVLFNARAARGLSSINQAEYLTDAKNNDFTLQNKSKFEECFSNHRFRQFYLTYENLSCPMPQQNSSTSGKSFTLPLGWFLSGASQNEIKNRVGGDSDCLDDLNGTSKTDLKTHNHCVFRSVKDELELGALSK